MSKWKAKSVKIIQIAHVGSWTIVGLGDDGMVYVWSESGAAWLKHWKEKDVPEAA